ncbi:MAG TPA: aminotransferase class IV [Sedimentisphaerales bacterium]|nr:aminotransferase class IV [Sedimentisphaerales bacterium]
MQVTMVDDKIVDAEKLDKVHFDRAMFFGDGVYEVIRSYNGKIFALEDHMLRFSNSLKAIGITAVTAEQVQEKVLKAFEVANLANAKIYFHVTRGSGPRKHEWDNNLKPNFFLTIDELGDFTAVKNKGIAVSTYPDLRWKRCDIKSLNLLANVIAKQDAAEKGYQEAILVDDRGFITEGAGSAFFAIFDGKIHVTPLGHEILPSVTRKYVLKAADNIGMETIQKQFTPDQAAQADELFIAVTTKDIVPVVKFDSQTIKNGNPGRYTKLLIEEFKVFTK